MRLVEKNVCCDRTLELIRKALMVGYIDPKSKQITKSKIGTPQGSVLSPLLANIVLHELDEFILNQIMPEYNKGNRRKTNPEYNALVNTRYGKKKGVTIQDKVAALKKMQMIPRMDPNDPNFRRSMFIRYADDFVFLFEGPHSEAITIKKMIKIFLEEKLGLILNDEKTLITHIVKGFLFLGAFIKGLRHTGFMMRTKTSKGKSISMRANARARVNMPTPLMIKKLMKNEIVKMNQEGKVVARPVTKLVNLDHATIIQFYNSKIHGIINYYSFAGNRVKILNLI